MTKLNSLSVSSPADEIVSSHLAVVVAARQSQAVTVSVNDVEIEVQHHAHGLPALSEGERVIIDLLGNGQAIVRTVLAGAENHAVTAQYHIVDRIARLELPPEVEGFQINLGNARIELHRDGRLTLNAQTIVSDAEGTHQITGHPVKLN